MIELELDGDAGPASTVARDVDGVTRVEALNGTLRAYSERGGEMIPALLHAAENSGRQVRDIRLHPPSLETLFIALTGRKLE